MGAHSLIPYESHQSGEGMDAPSSQLPPSPRKRQSCKNHLRAKAHQFSAAVSLCKEGTNTVGTMFTMSGLLRCGRRSRFRLSCCWRWQGLQPPAMDCFKDQQHGTRPKNQCKVCHVFHSQAIDKHKQPTTIYIYTAS